MSLSTILKEKRRDSGLSVKDVLTKLQAHNVNISDKTLYGWESGHRQPDADTFILLCEIYGIHSISEISGTNSPNDLTETEWRHIKKYRALDDHGKEIVTTVLECEYKRYSEQKKPSDPVIMLPIYDMWESPKIIYLPEPLQPAAAGYGDPADDETADMVPVRYNDATRKADYIMRVHGDSMEPELHDGDRVLVRSQPSVEIGQMGVFLDDGERVVKIYRGDHLESLNPEYPDLSFKGFSECKGLVIGILNPKWIAEE